jgi:hypothetical protein
VWLSATTQGKSQQTVYYKEQTKLGIEPLKMIEVPNLSYEKWRRERSLTDQITPD